MAVTVGTTDPSGGSGPGGGASILEVIATPVGAGALGAGSVVAAGMTPWSGLMAGAGGCVIGCSALVGVTRVRNLRRRELLDAARLALAATIGRSDRATLTARSWTGGWVGHPRKLVITYEPGSPSRSPEWNSSLKDALRMRLGAEYQLVKDDPRRCRMSLRAIAPAVGESATPPATQVRAERAITDLLGATAKVTRVEFAGDQLRRIHVTHRAGTRLAASGYRVRVERVLSTMMPGRWRAQWDLEGDSVVFEVRPNLPDSVWLPTDMPEDVDDLLRNYEKVRIPFAVDEDGEEIVWVPAQNPQFLITGGTGTGKTSSTHALVGKITQFGWPVWVLDGKRVEFLRFRDWPNVQIVATTIEQQVALVHRVWSLMSERYRLMEEEGLQMEDFEPLVVVLDEWAEFVAGLLEWYGTVKVRGGPAKPPTLRQEASIARLARTARIHLIKTMQRPDVSLMGGQGGEVRSNFGQRMSVGRIDPQGAIMMWDSPVVGVTIPRGARQRATATNADGRPVEVQAYRFPSMTAPLDSEQGQLREALRPRTNRHPRLLILPPKPLVDLDSSVEILPTFWDVAETTWALASDHPELDPVIQGQRVKVGAAGREATSVLAMLGLEGANTRRTGDSSTQTPVPGRPSLRLVDVGQDDWEDEDSQRQLDGYGEAELRSPHELTVGDLVETDEGSGVWVVVEEEPEDNVKDPSMVAISWRGDDDSDGVLCVPAGIPIPSRRPTTNTE